MIGCGQVMAILLCGVVVNNYYGLYASWDDLLGQTGSPGGHPSEHGRRRPPIAGNA